MSLPSLLPNGLYITLYPCKTPPCNEGGGGSQETFILWDDSGEHTIFPGGASGTENSIFNYILYSRIWLK